MNEGGIQGGWEFVWAAYAVTWIAFVAYGIYLFTRESGDAPDERS